MRNLQVSLLTFLLILFSFHTFGETYFLDDEGVTERTQLSSNEEGTSFELSINAFEAIQKQMGSPLSRGFQEIKLSGFDNINEVGRPALPYKSFLVLGKAEDLSVSIEKGQFITFSNLRPAPALQMPCRCSRDNFPRAAFNKKSFKDSGSLVKIFSLGDYRGREISKVVVTPFHYKESSGLSVYSKLSIQIKGAELIKISEEIEEENKEYIVVSPRSLEMGAREFTNLKESQGYETELHFLEDLGGTLEGLKDFLHRRYKDSKYQYAVLIGHETNLPTHIVSTSTDYGDGTPSDLPNFLMGGKGDKIPDVHYGRIVAETNDEVFRQVKKMEEYLDQSWSFTEGAHRHIGIASNEGSGPNDVEYMEQMMGELDRVFDLEPVKYFQDNTNSTPENLVKGLTEGAIWLNYIGHGSGTSWPSFHNGREFESAHIKEITPGSVKPIIIDVACQNGRFSYENKLGERFMNEHQNGEGIGALAFYGGTVDISWHPPAIMAVAINKVVAQKKVETLFQAILAGQLHLQANYDDTEAAAENFRWYHLFGDPSLELRL